MKETVITENNIKTLVDNFYFKVRSDASLHPIFSNAIEKEHSSWDIHLERMYAFWSSIMMNSKRYKGNPLQKHKDLPAFEERLFERWLELFAETSREVYISEIAEQYVDRSAKIAESLRYYLYHK